MANPAADSDGGAHHDTSTIIDLTTDDSTIIDLTTDDSTIIDLTTGYSTVIDPTADDLDSRIQALPQELQDTILSFTDAFDIPTVVKINEYDDECYRLTGRLYFADYKPPTGLQLNRKLRAKFARRYFSSVAFECMTFNLENSSRSDEEMSNLPGFHHLSKRFGSLEETHRTTIGTLLVCKTGFRSRNWFKQLSVDAKLIMKHLKAKVTRGDLDQLKLVVSCHQRHLLRMGDVSEYKSEKQLFDINGIRLYG